MRGLKAIFKKCRLSSSKKNLKREVVSTILFLFLGFLLGTLSKVVDNIAINDEIFWHRLLYIIDLRNVLSRLSIWALLALGIAVYSKRPTRASINVFCFFVGMLLGYYLITITVSGFFPKAYIIAWVTITLLTPILAYFIWYAKGIGWLAIVLSSMAVGFFINEALSYGIGFFQINYYPELFFLAISLVILYRKNTKHFLFILIGASIIAPIIGRVLPYVFGGL